MVAAECCGVRGYGCAISENQVGLFDGVVPCAADLFVGGLFVFESCDPWSSSAVADDPACEAGGLWYLSAQMFGQELGGAEGRPGEAGGAWFGGDALSEGHGGFILAVLGVLGLPS